GPDRIPDIVATWREAPLEKGSRGAAVSALNKNISGPLIARREHGGESPRGLRPAEEQVDEETARQPAHGSIAGAASGRVTRFGIGKQRIERLVALRAAQPLGHGFVTQ